jgi:Xaa-Pro aminopeptidase
VCPAFERDRAEEQIDGGPLAGDTDIMTWEEHENPWALLASGLRDRQAATGRIAIEETTYFHYSDGLARQLPAATLTSGTPVTAGCRMVKSPAELALMRLASEVTLRAYKAAWQCSVKNDQARSPSWFGSLNGSGSTAMPAFRSDAPPRCHVAGRRSCARGRSS